MARNRLTITHENDTIRLSWQRGQESTRFADAIPFQHPFDEQALTDLRWYLEEFLRFPYGIEPDKAKKIEQKLQEWGEQLFSLVFRSSEKARQFFQAATWDGLNQCQLSITSDDPAVLNLPWELLYSPDDRIFLAPKIAQMYRSLSDYKVRGEKGEMQQEKLNILLVIARPLGEKDIGFQTIARPMLAALKEIRQQVNLKVLRPPSFQEFERELNNNKSFYHIVHFDGHGKFDPTSVGFQHSFGGAGQGLLVFENPDGSPQHITAAQIAQSLTDCGVPIFVLNACKSAQEGSEPFSSVATRLVAEGAKGVVAMAYSVYAVGAKHFIGRLYEELVLGKSLAEAVAAGRLEMLNQRLRPSPKGDLPLQDWLVPVLYQQQSYQPFTPKAAPVSREEKRKARQEAQSRSLMDIPAKVGYEFIGRDYDILRLERAFRQNHVVLLQGMAGVGKTELTGGFARWLDETQGRIGGIFFTSFEQGAGLSLIVNQIGRVVWGEDFSQDLPEDQLDDVLDYLQNNHCLLIWDNFEPVAGFPTGNEPLLPADERDNLQRFLKELRGGKSWVLITSRREERWLDCGYTLLNLKGLDEKDAEEFAAKVLRTVGVDRAKLPPEYLELLKLLGGHPLSLRVVLPHLKTQSPVQLIKDLRQGGDRFSGVEEEGRDESLIVSLDYSFARLSDKCRQHLPFLGLFSEQVNAHCINMLSNPVHTYFMISFSGEPHNDFGQAYQAVFGEVLQESDWLRILNEAVEAGILEHLGQTLYKIHPALPWYLRQRLSERYPEMEVSNLEKKLLTSYAVLADIFCQTLISDAQIAIMLLLFEEPNLLQNLRLAEQCQEWTHAIVIVQALGEVYKRLGRLLEFKSMKQRLLTRIGNRFADVKPKGQRAIDLWIYLHENNFTTNNIAEIPVSIYQEIIDALTELEHPLKSTRIAHLYYDMGGDAEQKRDFIKAIDYYNKALDILNDEGDTYRTASIYAQLGIVAQKQGDFNTAITYYQKALEILIDSKDFYRVAKVYNYLGVVATEKRDFDMAIIHCSEALELFKGGGYFYDVATTYTHLGAIALGKEKFQDASNYYKEAIRNFEDVGETESAAVCYHQMGTLAYLKRDLEPAKLYYKKALEIRLNNKDFYKAANQYHQLGMVAEEKQDFTSAIRYYNQSLQICENFGDFNSAATDYHQLGIVAHKKGDFYTAITNYKKAFEIFQELEDWYKACFPLRGLAKLLEENKILIDAMKIYIKALSIDIEYDNKELIDLDILNLARMLKLLGESEFLAIWREVTDGECDGDVRAAIWSARDNLETE
ncbi:tetratricopeptide repeat protein [Argonema galeatum]|uniref:tetratricopeptide repeat protein n=1 Tax=Argonema galeatum TaxID=2942762 RepID=UPI002011611C|nr:tetratricopeptide repeat protein [Argonema galeatum]MCL1467967.1 tetratricopeptide repeat protein [Argonema galeatum A003/A1]